MAKRFAIDLSGVALGIWEAARLLSSKKTADEGRCKLARLRKRIETFTRRPILGDSLRVYFDQEFSPDEYTSMMDRLEREDISKLIPEIQKLVERTQNCLNETRRTRTDFQRALRYH